MLATIFFVLFLCLFSLLLSSRRWLSIDDYSRKNWMAESAGNRTEERVNERCLA